MALIQTFSVDFIIRKCKGNKKFAFIYARITVDGDPKEASTKNKILAADWLSKEEKVKGKGIDAKSINDYLEDVRSQIRAKYRELQKEPVVITAETVRSAYLGLQPSLKGKKLTELLTYYEQIWKAKLKPSHYKNIETTIKYTNRFLVAKFTAKDVYLSQINIEFITNLEHYIRTNPIKANDPCNGNGLGKHLERFKRIMEWAGELKWIESNAIAKYSCGVKKSKRAKLKIQEVVAIDKAHFIDPVLTYVKDLFLYSCFSGLAYADIMKVEKQHFHWEPGGEVLCLLYRTKSDGLCPIPLLKKAAEILNKHKDDPAIETRKTIFPYLTNQQVNRALKIIQEVCGIETKLTFHVARHTFATTIALKNGIPIETVQIMLGHTKITTTLIYAEVDEEKVATDTIGLNDKLQKKMDAASLMIDQRGSLQVI